MITKECIYCWGKNEEGQMGVKINSEYVKIEPSLFFLPFNSSIKQICCGENHTIILTEDGCVYSSGSNEYCQLGRNGAQRVLGKISSLDAKIIVDISCGKNHTLLLERDGSVYGFGYNDKGQLGHELCINTILNPKRIPCLPTNITYISSGFDSSFAITNVGDVYSWGSNTCSQLGYKSQDSRLFTPHIIPSFYGIPISKIQCGLNHSAALSSNGILYTWGSNSHGQIGNSTSEVIEIPTFLSQFENIMIVDVCCGQHHTVALSNTGKVFTFGSGRCGQLGHGNLNNSANPGQILDLCGTTISHISCGREHTVVCSDLNNLIYAFGCCNFGQCGTGGNINFRSFIFPMKLPSTISVEEIATPLFTKFVVCGADFCIVVMTTDDTYNLTKPENVYPPPAKILSYGRSKCFIEHDETMNKHSTDNENLDGKLNLIFSSISCLNCSFMRKDKPTFFTNQNNIDYSMVNQFVEKLSEKARTQTIVINSVCKILFGLREYRPIHPEGHRFIYYIFLFPLCEPPLDFDPFMNICQSIFDWGEKSFYLQKFRDLPPSCFKNFISKIKKHLLDLFLPYHSHVASYSTTLTKEQIATLICKLLSQLYHINEEHKIVSYTCFYLSRVAQSLPIYDEYCKTLSNPGIHELCRHFYLFDTTIKAKFVLLNSVFSTVKRLFPQKQIEGLTANALLSMAALVSKECLFKLRVRRDHILEDTTTELIVHSHEFINKIIMVEFIGEVGLDQGGVSKEFFFLIIKELFTVDYGLLALNNESQLMWFPEHSLFDEQTYYLVGILISLATFNSVILDLPFPLALYSKLLNKPIELSHLEELDPILAKGFQYMLDYNEDDFEQVFPLTFQIERMVFGEIIKVDLIENGANISVTAINKNKYVEKYIDYIFNRSCEKTFRKFQEGFYSLDIDYFKNMFNPMELKELITGNQEYDFILLQKATMYGNGYSNTHPVILNFWNVLHSLDLDLKKKFLQFATGTSNIPVTGISSINFKITQMNVDIEHLPVSHTCVNLLELPPYPDETKLREKLVKAVENCQGFGLV